MSLKTAWRKGEFTTGLWSFFDDPVIIELGGRSGFDYVTIDMQHGFTTWQLLTSSLRAMRLTDAAALVRVPTGDPELIGRALDLGADGVVVPVIEDVETAARAVNACRYPTPANGLTGTRSFGPTYGELDGVKDIDQSNADVVCAIQIETAKGVENLDEIIALDGVDAVYIGPFDLALSYGLPGATYRDSEMIDSIMTNVVQRVREAGVVAGMHCDGPEMAAYWRERGVLMLTADLDTTVVHKAFTTLAKQMRG